MSWWQRFDIWFENFLVNFLHDPETDPRTLPMNQDPIPPVVPNPDVLGPWDTPANCRHNVRVIADMEGLTVDKKDDFSKTIHCESNYNPKCIHPNIVNGHVSSTDFGIAQINDYWHIGPGKDFPSSDYVLNNPEACVRWMAKQWLAGNGRLWVCKLKNLNLHYSA